jgi:hypothetical protein
MTMATTTHGQISPKFTRMPSLCALLAMLAVSGCSEDDGSQDASATQDGATGSDGSWSFTFDAGDYQGELDGTDPIVTGAEALKVFMPLRTEGFSLSATFSQAHTDTPSVMIAFTPEDGADQCNGGGDVVTIEDGESDTFTASASGTLICGPTGDRVEGTYTLQIDG